MTTTQWIILAAVIVVLLLVILLVVGNARRKKKTISFEEKKAPEQLTQAEKSGNYQATGGFDFAPAKKKDPEVLPGQEMGASPAKPADKPAEKPAPPAPSAEPLQPMEKKVEPTPPTPPTPPVREPEPEVEVEPEPEVEVESAEDMTVPEVPAELASEPALPEVEDIPEPAPDAVPPADLAPEPVEAAEPEAAPAAPEEAETEVVPPAPEPVVEKQIDEIAPTEGRLARLKGRLSRSQNAIGQSVLGILGAGDLDEDAWEEIEDTLIMADLGTTVTMNVVEKLRERIASRGVDSEAEARALLREVLIEECGPDMDRSIRALPHEGKPAVVLVVGVNGTGKTTTTGKLARVLVAQGHDVLLGAADTFRAAAADQLETWGRRVGATTVRGPEGADPASIAFDAVAKGIDAGSDVVLIDTAGRLHTKTGLMDQLGKVKRVVEKKAAVDEVLLVLDATVGQNGLIQARTFRDVVDITGVVLTKLDGTAKGGIVFQVQRELGVPVKLVGLGEGADHLAPFEPEGFVDALLG